MFRNGLDTLGKYRETDFESFCVCQFRLFSRACESDAHLLVLTLKENHLVTIRVARVFQQTDHTHCSFTIDTIVHLSAKSVELLFFVVVGGSTRTYK